MRGVGVGAIILEGDGEGGRDHDLWLLSGRAGDGDGRGAAARAWHRY